MKKIIIGIAIGGIIFGTIGVLAANTISSSIVTYNSKTVEKSLDELYDEAVTGKGLIATAITNKGVTTSNTATYQTMATNISSIDTDHSTINQKITNLESKHNTDITSLTSSINNISQSLGTWSQKAIAINSSGIKQSSGHLLVNETLRLAIFSLEFLTSTSGTDLTLFNPEANYYPKYDFNIGINAYNGAKNGILYAKSTGFKCTLPSNGETWYHVFFVYNY